MARGFSKRGRVVQWLVPALTWLGLSGSGWAQDQDWPLELTGADLPFELVIPSLSEPSVVVAIDPGGEPLLTLDGSATQIGGLLGRGSAVRAVVGTGSSQRLTVDTKFASQATRITLDILPIDPPSISLWQQVEAASEVNVSLSKKQRALQTAYRSSNAQPALRRELNHALAKALLAAGRTEAAIDRTRIAVEDYVAAGEPARAAGAEVDLARALLANGQLDAAAGALASADTRAADRWTQAIIEGTRCRLQFQAGNLSQARDCIEQANRVSNSEGFMDLYASGAVNLGVFESRLGNVDAGRQAFNEALPLLENPANKSARAGALSNLAVLEQRSGNLRRAAALYTEARVAATELGNRRLELISLNNLGGIAFELGDFDRAAALFEEVLAARREQSQGASLAIALNNVGEAQLGLGNTEAALKYHTQALELAQELGAYPSAIRAEVNLADTLRQIGDEASLKRAAEYATSALREARVRGTPRLRARAEITLGVLTADLGNPREGEMLLRDSIQTSARLYNRFAELKAHRFLVDLLVKRGDTEAALEQAQIGMAVATRTRRELNVDQRTRFTEVMSALNEELVVLLAELHGSESP